MKRLKGNIPMRIWFAFLFIFNISGRLGATIIHVPSEYPTIQEGINAANYGDTVLVAPGTYPEYDIIMKDGVYLKSEEGPENTIIDPDTLGRDHRIFKCDGITATIDGFTICNGSGHLAYGGGGIFSFYSHVVIKNNIIRNNECYSPLEGANGGGILVHGGSCVIENNVIRGNVAHPEWPEGVGGLGGGICIRKARAVINSNIIENNSAWHHGGDGGGIYCGGDSEVVIINNIIANNYVDGFGGGIYCSAPAVITNNTIAFNRITALFHDTLVYYGGAIFCTNDSIVIKDNIIAFNMAGTGGGIFCSDSAHVLITYNDFFGNIGGNFYNPPYGVGNFTWGGNREWIACDSFYNINVDPMFTSGPGGNYYLSHTCIDCGSFRVERGFELRTTTPDGKPDTGWVDLGYHYGTAPIIVTGIEEEFSQPNFSSNPYFLKCYPNPFSSQFNIEFKLPLAMHVKISIYDILGKRLATVVDGVSQSGFVVWNSQKELRKSLANGIYFVCLQTQNYTRTEKIVSLK